MLYCLQVAPPPQLTMNKAFNIILYITIVSAVLQNAFVVAIPLAVWFTFRCGSIWLFPAAVLIDGYFGAFYSVPVFSLTICLWFLLTEVIRPQLLWQHSYE